MYKGKDTAFNGIYMWVSNHHYELIKDKVPTKESSNLRKLIRDFLIEYNLPRVRQTSKNYNNLQVQKNFKRFKEWVNNR